MTGLPRTRPVRLLLAVAAVLALPAVGPGQPLPPPPPPPPLGPPAESEVFPHNDDLAPQILKTAPDYINSREWATVARVLQGVLDAPGDFLLKKEEKSPGGKTIVRYVSGRAEAERLLMSLPKPGLAAYRLKYGGAATVLLGSARNNPALLEEVARRYFLTDAGAEALTRMGLYELDRGRSEEAADRFRRLLQRPDADELPPLTLFQAALAFHAANDPVREEQAVQLLSRRVPPTGLLVGGQLVSLNDLRKEIARYPTAAAVSGDWPLFRGDQRRTGRAEGDFPLLEARKSIPLPAYEEVNDALAPAPGAGPVAGPYLPGGVPLAVGGKIVYRAADGLHARDAETTQEVWRHESPLCLAALLRDDNQRGQLLGQWLPKYRGLPTLLDENATLGTLSSDGRRVYFIEDVPLPPHPNDLMLLQQPQVNGRPWFSTLEPNLYHNRLRAVDLTTGDFRWEVGGWDRSPNPPQSEFADVFFLGPPLPVGRRLFVLGEQTLDDKDPKKKKNKDVLLYCLDPETGRLLWSQDLAVSAETVGMDPTRRMQAAHLAYADGVLVCPTNAGSVVAVDPVTHNLLWAHLYHDQVNNPNPNGVPTFTLDEYEAGWKGCAPIVHGDRVVFTAPDGDSVLCLNLRDGSEVWKALRTNEDVYVAGVFGDRPGEEKVLVVGANTCRALRLADGTEAAGWGGVPTGQPAGLGTADGNFYLLPLRNGNLLVLDTSKPGAFSVIEGRPDDPPGNLVFHGGDLWSQSRTAVTAYPQLGKGLERAEARVAKDPRDPVARIDRGRLYFSKGDAARAVEDWLIALDNNPPPDLAAQTSDRLYRALTQLLRQDFSTYEKYMGQYEKLCRRPAPAGATPDQARAYQAEQRRRLLNLLVVVAHGREAQGRADEARQVYRDLYETAAPGERLRAPEDPAVDIRVDLWIQARIADLVKGATPEKQKLLKDRIDQDWRAAQSSGDAAALVRFVALYGMIAGPLGAPGREARLALAERWMEDRDPRHALDAELNLRTLRDQTDSPEIAARAQFARARLLTRHGLLADAVAAYRELARDFPAVPVHDGQTGAALLEGLAVDKRFVAYLDDPLASRPTGRVKFVEMKESNAPTGQDLPCDPADGNPPPCCRNLRFSIDAETYALKVASTDGSSEPWSCPLPVPAAYLHALVLAGGGYSFTYQASDHFLVVSLGPLIVGVDRIERRARWVRSLLPADLPKGVEVAQITSGGTDGSIYVTTSDNRGLRLGVLGPVGPNGVLIETRSGVADLDASTGEVRWLRDDGSPMLSGFGDEQHLYLVESRADGGVFAVHAVRTSDGLLDPIPDCIDVERQRINNLGRCLLSGNQGDNDNPLELRFYDPQTGKDLWKGTFPVHSLFVGSPVPELFAVAAPDGTVTVVDLEAGKEVAKLVVDKKDVDQLVRGTLLRDRTQYYVVLQGPPAPNALVVGDPAPNFNGAPKWVEVNGGIYAFDRQTGALQWKTARAIEAQILLLDHFEESPVLLMAAIQARQVPNSPGNQVQWFSTLSIDKATGKFLYKKEVANEADPYFSLEVDPRTGTVDLVNSTTRLRHFIDGGK